MAPLVLALGNLGLNFLSSYFEKNSTKNNKKVISFINEKTGIDISKTDIKEDGNFDLKKEEIKKLFDVEEELTKRLSLQLEETKIVLNDKQNARSMNVLLNSSYNNPNSWLTKNTGSLIALFTTLFTFGLWFAMLMDFTYSVNENILFAINSGLTLSLGYVLSFYFGSSKNESDIQRSKLHKKNSTAANNTDPDFTNLTSTTTDEELTIKS